jgi:hypothetical protein
MRAMAKAHPLIEKTMQIVCALKGFKQLTWNTAKDFLGKGSFKTDLL